MPSCTVQMSCPCSYLGIDKAACRRPIRSVADWDHTLSLYAKDGTLLADVAQDAAPNCLAPIGGGELVAVGSSNKKVTLSTPDGRKLNDLVTDTAWVWGVAAWTPPKPEIEPTLLAVGSESGQVSVYEIESGMVHSIFRARHAFREGMTTVQVRHLVTGARLAIRCSSFVQRVSVFQDRLAVQMQDRVSVYDLGGDALTGVNAVYKKRAQINRAIDCDLMLVTSANLLLCLGAKLQSLGFDDQLQREWAMDAPVKYIKVLGGKPGQEGLLLGLANGQVQQVTFAGRQRQSRLPRQAAMRRHMRHEHTVGPQLSPTTFSRTGLR